MNLKLKFICTFIVLFLAGCALTPSRSRLNYSHSPLLLRCPAQTADCKTLIPPPNSSSLNEIVKIPFPPPSDFRFSPMTYKVVESLNRLGLPEATDLPEDYLAIIELTLSQFVEAYESFPGGSQLLQILKTPGSKSGTELRLEIAKWAETFIPGYRIEWNPPGDSNVIEEKLYFELLGNRVIAMGDHHDVLAHLFLFADPKIRELTERIVSLYPRALEFDKNSPQPLQKMLSAASIVNMLWTRLQEYTPIQYKDRSGKLRIAILGGSPTAANPSSAFHGEIETWIYFLNISRLYSSLEAMTELNISQPTHGTQFARVIEHIQKITAQTKENSHSQIIENMNKIPLLVDTDFKRASKNALTYEERWVEFSNQIFRPDQTGHLLILRPENHRKLLELSIELVESLLSS